MRLNEVILCATAPSSNPGPGSIHIHDIQTGSSLASFKQTNTNSHCIAVTESRDGLGGFMLAAQQDKSILNVYNFQKDQIALKFVLPERLTCCAVDRRGEFFAGGTSQGRIYVWEISSGILYNAWDGHYRQVNVLRFSHDGAALISGSEDSGVTVWEMSRILDDNSQNELPTPYCTFSDHTLPITDIICGVGAFPSCRLLTSSVDHSAKVWDLSSRTLLTTFHFPYPITHLVWDPTERVFFASSSGSEGLIFQVNLFEWRGDGKGKIIEAVGGSGPADVVRIGDEDQDEGTRGRKKAVSVGQRITALCMSLTSTNLLVGTHTGHIHIYDIPSHQLLRTISTHKDLSVTHLNTMLRPPDLVGHVNIHLGLTSNVGVSGGTNQAEVMSLRVIMPFDRTRDASRREAREVAMILPVQDATAYIDPTSYPEDELIRDHAYFTQDLSFQLPSSKGAPNTGASLQSRVAELESEVQKLREQLGKAKNVNDVMWETVVKKAVKEKEKKGGDGDGDVDMEGDEANHEEKRRKRGRT